MPSPYTLTAAVQTYTLTPQNPTSALVTRLVTAAVRAYAMTMQAATVLAGGGAKIISDTAAAFVLTMQAARPRAGLSSYRNIYIPFHKRRRRVI